MTRDRDERFMGMCLRLAGNGKGYVSPNPLVGAVLVKGGHVVARGYHQRFGGPHAEVECLRSFKGNTRNATLYVNLEPCSHHGKTPPCADLIIDSGIRTVVVGMKDPNPLVAGKGIRKLKKAGVKVVLGVLEAKARSLNRHFITHVAKQRPFVHVKIAQTLDGKIGLNRNTPSEISSIESRRMVHRWRAEHDAILVGAGTIRSDNPRLTVRLLKGRDPSVVVLDGALSLNSRYKVFRDSRRRRTILFVTEHANREQQRRARELTSSGVMLIPMLSEDITINPKHILRKLYEMGIGSVLVEGGSNVFTQFLLRGTIDLMSVFVSPKVYGEGVPAFSGDALWPLAAPPSSGRLESMKRVGKDVLLQFGFNKGS